MEFEETPFTMKPTFNMFIILNPGLVGIVLFPLPLVLGMPLYLGMDRSLPH